MLIGDIIYNKKLQRFGVVKSLPYGSSLFSVKHHKYTYNKIYYVDVIELNTEADFHITMKYKRNERVILTDFEKDLIKKLKLK